VRGDARDPNGAPIRTPREHEPSSPDQIAARRRRWTEREVDQAPDAGLWGALQAGLGNARVAALETGDAGGDVALYLQHLLRAERALGLEVADYLPWRAHPSWLEGVRPLYRVAWAERHRREPTQRGHSPREHSQGERPSVHADSASAPRVARPLPEDDLEAAPTEEILFESLPAFEEAPSAPAPRAPLRRAYLPERAGAEVGVDPWGLRAVWRGGVTEQALLQCLRESLPPAPPAPPLSLVHEGLASLNARRRGAGGPGLDDSPRSLRGALLEGGPPSPEALSRLQSSFAPYPRFAEAAQLQVEALISLDVGRVEASAAPLLAMRRARGGEERWDPAAVLASIRQSRGAPLPADVAARLGAALGHDVRHVWVHTDAAADAAARALSARAFTTGSDIYFAQGTYAPGSPEGDRLLLHELTHVAQHDRGELAAEIEGLSVSDPADRAEREASAAEALPLTSIASVEAPAVEAPEPERPAHAISRLAWSLLRDEEVEATATPEWARQALASVGSFFAYHLIEGLLTAWRHVGTNDQKVVDVLDATIVNFDASLTELHRGAGLAPDDGGDGGISMEQEIEMLQETLLELKGAAVGAEQSDYELEATFELASDFFVQWDVYYDAAEKPPPGEGEGGGGGLLDLLLTIILHTLGGDFVEDPHIVAIIIRALLGLIPYLDQALDAEDVVGSLYHLIWEGKIDDVWIWVGLVLTLIGCIPELGSVIKGVGKSGVKLVRVIAKKGAGEIKLGRLFNLLDDVGKKLPTLDEKLKVILQQWDELLAKWGDADIAGPVGQAIRDLLTRVETKAAEARELVRSHSPSLAAKFDEVIANCGRAKQAVDGMVAEAVARGRKAIEDITQFVKEEIGVRRLKRALGDEAFQDLVDDLGEGVVRKLSADLDAAAIADLTEKLGADLLGKLAADLKPQVIQALAEKLGKEAIEEIGDDVVSMALRGVKGEAIPALRALSPAQLDGFLRLDAGILEDFAKNSPARQAELFGQTDDLLRASKYDEVYEKYPGGSGNIRHGHAMSKHGPHVSDEEMFKKAAAGDPQSRWDNFGDMTSLIDGEIAKFFDASNQVAGNPYCILNSKGLKAMMNGKTFQEILDNASSNPFYFLKKLATERKPVGRRVGTEYDPDGTTTRAVEHFTVRLELDGQGAFHLDTAYPDRV